MIILVLARSSELFFCTTNSSNLNRNISLPGVCTTFCGRHPFHEDKQKSFVKLLMRVSAIASWIYFKKNTLVRVADTYQTVTPTFEKYIRSVDLSMIRSRPRNQLRWITEPCLSARVRVRKSQAQRWERKLSRTSCPAFTEPYRHFIKNVSLDWREIGIIIEKQFFRCVENYTF